MSDSRDLWARLVADGKPKHWKRAAPMRKPATRTSTRPTASEADVLKLLQDAAALVGVTLLRNNVGALQDAHGRWVTFGLGIGSSDFVGWKSVKITPEMVGHEVAVFVAIEAKREVGGTVSVRQQQFIERVLRAGGLAGIARNAEDLHQILGNYILGSRH